MSVVSLLDQCIHLCAQHIQHIDSLVGFPADFGAKILRRAIDLGTFDTDNIDACKALRLYGEAGEFFQTLSIPNIFVLNEFEECMCSLIEFVVKLDLTSVSLGDNHDLLSFLPQCQNLTTLVLEDTDLTDKGMKKVTYPAFDRRKLPFLQYLDISGLKLSVKYMQTLRHLPQLSQILLQSDDVDQLGTVPGFRVSARPSIQKVRNDALAVSLLIRWIRLTQARRDKQHTHGTDHSQVSSFYSTTRKVNKSPNKQSVSKTKRSKSMLLRTNLNNSPQDVSSATTRISTPSKPCFWSIQTNSKRGRSADDTPHDNSSSKKSRLAQDLADKDDGLLTSMLNLYR